MSDIEVMAARAEERDALANMMQLYTHDFSEQWSTTPRGDLQDDGRFPAYPLDAYWREADHVPLLFRLGGSLMGFALLNGLSHSGRPVERNMAEFFITRKYRRCGLGSAAAQKIFSCYPGLWEIAVAQAKPRCACLLASCDQNSSLRERRRRDRLYFVRLERANPAIPY